MQQNVCYMHVDGFCSDSKNEVRDRRYKEGMGVLTDIKYSHFSICTNAQRTEKARQEKRKLSNKEAKRTSAEAREVPPRFRSTEVPAGIPKLPLESELREHAWGETEETLQAEAIRRSRQRRASASDEVLRSAIGSALY